VTEEAAVEGFEGVSRSNLGVPDGTTDSSSKVSGASSSAFRGLGGGTVTVVTGVAMTISLSALGRAVIYDDLLEITLTHGEQSG
jgi:hypothetical protein